MSKQCDCIPETKVGNRFDRLEIIENVGIVKGHTSFKCKCDCGNTVTVRGSHLKTLHTKSCGCLQRKKALDKAFGIIGQNYGRLKVLKIFKIQKGNVVLKCKCECGNIKNVTYNHLVTNHTKSCGCLSHGEISKHGMSKTLEYKTWDSIYQRCYNPNNISYKNYGGRGINISSEWRNSFENFYKDMGKRPENLTIERVNNNLGYSKENCIWASRTTQSRNQRLHKNNKTGIPGVYLNKKSQKYIGTIRANNNRYRFGSFSNLNDAKNARRQAEQKYWEKEATK